MGAARYVVTAVLICLTAGVEDYTGPKRGGKSNEKVKFSHVSDWQPEMITNTVENQHDSKSLVVDWPAAGITRRERSPLPAGKSDVNEFSCPPDCLATDDDAKLYYGLRHDEKPAAVYFSRPPSKGESLRSSITLSTEDEPYRLRTESQLRDGEAVYRLELNRPFDVALPLAGSQREAFAHGRWKETIDEPRGREEIRSYFGEDRNVPRWQREVVDTYVRIAPPDPASTVVVKSNEFELRPLVVFLCDRDVVIGSGVVVLHVPRNKE